MTKPAEVAYNRAHGLPDNAAPIGMYPVRHMVPIDPQVLIRRHIRHGNFAATRPRPSFTPWPMWTRDVSTGELLSNRKGVRS